MRTSAITLRARSVIAFFRGCHARHSTSRHFHLLTCARHQFASLTFVFRSTHSSQLNVGLLRFCFFLGGWSCPCTALSGLVERCASSMMRQPAGHFSVLRRCDATLAWICGCTRPPCARLRAGIKDDVFPEPQKATRGCAEDILGVSSLEHVHLSSP
ncbi:hypothetical protein DE146DRAFT_209043 [Phaeosphaeria sp. MPI-PUGE-AT-0046c]|nr:hypothetical protein DE146DRAFT_209043 [Phaeosphaeria sp. MPI-PUGE-AT-0046c]